MRVLTLEQAAALLGDEVYAEDEAAFDRLDAAEAAEWASLPYPRPRGDRCDDCGYRADTLGHRSECEAPQ